MKKIYTFFLLFIYALLTQGQILIEPTGKSISLGFNIDGGIAEITAFDKYTKKLYVINGVENKIYVYDFSNPTAYPLTVLSTISIPGSGSINSIACARGIVAATYENAVDRQQPGYVQLITTTGDALIGSPITVGAQPDMITFTPQGDKLLVANEGEAHRHYIVDPEGSVSIINVSDPFNPTVQHVTFTSLNGTIPHLSTFPNPTPSIIISGMKNSVTPIGPTNVRTPSTVAEDLEPEYIVVSPDGQKAWVSCQENNAMIIIDIPSATLTTIIGLGYKDHNLPGNGLDIASSPGNTAAVNIRNIPFKGIYMPDGMSIVTLGGIPYILTANEGDGRDYRRDGTGQGTSGPRTFRDEVDANGAFLNRINTSAPGMTYSILQAITASGMRFHAGLGASGPNPFLVNTVNGDQMNVGNLFSELYTFGTRSFSIWNGLTGQLVWDSGDQIEQITYRLNPANFNTNHSETNVPRARSHRKGPEPEAVVSAKLGDSLYAFVGLERIGGFMVFNITNISAPYFVNYINNRDFSINPPSALSGDLGPEGLLIIKPEESPDGFAYLVVSNEVSGTVSTYRLKATRTLVRNSVAPFIRIQNQPSSPVQAITLSGTGLSNAVGLNVSSDFEISLSSISGFTNSLTLTGTGGVINALVYARYVGTDAYKTGQISFNNGSGLPINMYTFAGIFVTTVTGTSAYTLQLLHASDFEAGLLAMENAPRFVAIWHQFNSEYPNTLRVSGGDNYLPSPFFNASADIDTRGTFSQINRAYLGTAIGTNIREGIGRADINIMNLLDIHASAVGNHEFDAGTGTFAEMIGMQYNDATNPTQVRWMGTRFPYLSANLDFSGDANLKSLYTPEIRNTQTYKASASSEATILGSSPEARKKIAPAAIATIGGEAIGIVGATTQIVEKISSTGGVKVKGTSVDDMPLLAEQLQPVIDDLRARGINKIVLLSHLQQITFEKALAPLLSGVDIIVSAGSHTLMADANDETEGDTKVENYPFITNDKDGNKTLIVCTESEYKYVGRLVVDFDNNGNVITSSLNSTISGAWKASEAGLLRASVNTVTAFSGTHPAYLTKGLIEGINAAVNQPAAITISGVTATTPGIRRVIISQDGNILGKTQLFIEGRRELVRLQETNLGNLSADANLAEARKLYPDVMISIKNGGGIRAAIGVVSAVGSNFVLLPPLANTNSGKQYGDVSQLDILNSLRFNNTLSVGNISATNLFAVINHAVKASAPGVTPGQFAQVGGLSFSWDPNLPAGSRVRNLAIVNDEGKVIDVIAKDGMIVGDGARTYKAVTLDFLVSSGGAGTVGGDSYPLNTATFVNRVNLSSAVTINGYNTVTGAAAIGTVGGEQDAFAKYMRSNYSSTGFNIADTPEELDMRIQNLSKRSDAVLPGFSMPTTTFTGYLNKIVTISGVSISGVKLGVPIYISVPTNVSVNGLAMATVNGMGGVVNIQTLMPTGAGTSTFVVTLSAANITSTFTHIVIASVEPVNPTVSFSSATITLGSGNLDLNTLASTNSDGSRSFSILSGTAASISGSELTPVSVGTVQVSFSTSATATYNATTVSTIITVVAASAPMLTVLGQTFTYTRNLDGAPSAELAQFLTVAGIHLTSNVTVSSSLSSITFDDASDFTTNFVNPLVLTPVSGILNQREVMVRFVSTIAGTYTGTVMVTAQGVIPTTFSVVAVVNSAPIICGADSIVLTSDTLLVNEVYTLNTSLTGIQISDNALAEVSGLEVTAKSIGVVTVTGHYGSPCKTYVDVVLTIVEPNAARTLTSNWAYYPNPITNGVVYFSKLTSGSIYNIQGLKMLDFKDKTSVNVSNIQKGLYIVKTIGNGSHKLVIE